MLLIGGPPGIGKTTFANLWRNVFEESEMKNLHGSVRRWFGAQVAASSIRFMTLWGTFLGRSLAGLRRINNASYTVGSVLGIFVGLARSEIWLFLSSNFIYTYFISPRRTWIGGLSAL